jgi:O-antigen/teichoic acid export membrane protein
VGLVFAALQQTLTLWATRLSAFGTSARSSVIAAGMQTASQIGLGVPGTGVLGLVVGYLIGRVGGIGVLLGTITSTRWSTLRHTSPRRIRAVAVRFRRFPLYVLWAALLNTLSVQAPVLLLAAMFDTTVVGWFSITVRVLQLPSTIIGNAVAQVFYARVSRESHVGARATTAAVYRSLLALGTGPMVLLAIGGQQLFSFAFGDAWTEAGAYAQWLAPWLLLVFVTSPLSTLVYVRERQGAELVFQIVLLVVRTTSLVVGWVMGSATLAIALFGIASAASWGPYMLWLLRLGGVRASESLSWLSRNLAIALLLAAPLLFFTILGVQGIAWAVLATVTLVVMLLRARHEIAAGEMPSEPEMPAEAARPEDGDSGTYPE